MAKKDLNVKLKITADGKQARAEIKGTAEATDQLGTSADKATPEMRELGAEMDKLAAETGLIENYRKLESTLGTTEEAMAAAKREVAFLKDGMEKAGKDGANLFRRDLEKAKKEVLRLADKQRKYQKELKGLSGEMKSAGINTKRLSEQQRQTTAEYAAAAKKLEILTNKHKTAEKATASLGKATEKVKAHTAKPLPDNTGPLRAGLNKSRVAADRLGAAIKGFVLYQLGRLFISANKDAESLSKGLELVTGSAEAAAEEMQFVRQTAALLGTQVASTGKAYLDLTAAAKGTTLEGEQTRQIFTSISQAMARLGKSSADTEGALLAVQQMISKGKVSAEELRGQLGERLPGAFQAAARAMGVTTAELDSMLQSGQLVAEDLLPALADELDKTFDTGEKIDSFAASWNRFTNTVTGAFQAIEESAGVMGGLGAVLGAVGTTLNFVVVGFVTIAEKVKASATAVGAFWDLLSKKSNLTDFRTRVDEAFEAADTAIAAAADRAFSVGENLKVASDAGKKAGKSIAEGMTEAGIAAARTKEDLNAAADAVKRIDGEMSALGMTVDELNSGMTRSTRESFAAFNRLMIEAGDNSVALVRGLQRAAQGVDDLDVLRAMTLQVAAAVDAGRLSDEQAAIAKQTLAARAQAIADDLRGVGMSTEDVTKKTDALTESLDEIPGDVNVKINVKTIESGQKLDVLKGKTKEVTKATKEQGEAAKETGDAVEQSGEQTGAAAGIMAKMITTMENARNGMRALSDGALKMFDDLMSVYVQSKNNGIIHPKSEDQVKALSHEIRRLSKEAMFSSNEISKWYKQIGIAAAQTEIEFIKQTNSANGLIKSLEDWGETGQAVSQTMLQNLNAVGQKYALIDDATLSRLESEVNRVTAANERMEQSAESALERYEDMISRQAGNDLEIKEREKARALAQIEKDLAFARKTGNMEAIADLEKAAKLAAQYHNEEIRLLKVKLEEEKKVTVERQARDGATIPTLPARPAGTPPVVQRPDQPTTLPAGHQQMDPALLKSLNDIRDSLSDTGMQFKAAAESSPAARVVQLRTPDGNAITGRFSDDDAERFLRLLDDARMVAK